MPVIVNGSKYFRTAEVYRMIGISRNTLYRWLEHGVLSGHEIRDWRGWRLFKPEDITTLKEFANQIEEQG